MTNHYNARTSEGQSAYYGLQALYAKGLVVKICLDLIGTLEAGVAALEAGAMALVLVLDLGLADSAADAAHGADAAFVDVFGGR